MVPGRRGAARMVVAVTDYPGLGTPGLHPYVVGKTNGRAVLDIMRAARNLPQTGLRADCATGIYGYPRAATPRAGRLNWSRAMPRMCV